MTKKDEKKLEWRLGNLPTIQELTDLLEKGVITKEEVREILFTRQDLKEMPKETEVVRYVTTHYQPPHTEIINRFVKDFWYNWS